MGIDVYDELEQRFLLRFGDSDVPIKFIQKGVFKCHAPSHSPGYVELSLLYDGKAVSDSGKNNSNIFQYKEAQQSKKKVYVRMRDHNSSMLDSEPREFKVRLIETLTGLEHDLSSYSNQSSQGRCTKQHSATNFNQLQHLDIKILEKINRNYFIRVIRMLLNKMKQIYGLEQSSRVLNKCDNKGLSIIHYIVCLDYYELIADLHTLGANLSLATSIPGKDNENMIPIVICSAKGFQNTLSELLKYVAIPYRENEKEIRLAHKTNNLASQGLVHMSNIADEKEDISDHEEEEEKNPN